MGRRPPAAASRKLRWSGRLGIKPDSSCGENEDAESFQVLTSDTDYSIALVSPQAGTSARVGYLWKPVFVAEGPRLPITASQQLFVDPDAVFS